MVLPDIAVTMSPGRCARLPGMFSTQGMKAVTGIDGFNCAMRPHGADHGRAARHVVLHLLHAVGRLDGDAAGVERDALAHQAQVRAALRLLAGGSGSRSAPGGSALPCATPSSAPMPSFSICAWSSTSHSRPIFGSHLLGGVGDLRGRQQVGRFVHQAAREILRLGDDPAALGRPLRSSAPSLLRPR